MFRKSLLAAVAACLLVPAVASAQSAPSSDAKAQTILSHMPKQIVDCQPHDEAREKADTALTQTAWNLLNTHDIATLRTMQPQLEVAAGHAPDKPPLPEKCGDKLIVYSANMLDVLLAAGALQKQTGSHVTVEAHDPLPYARLDFIIGWLYFEADKRDVALGWYERGLKNDPHHAMLASEYANTLSQLGRSADALAFTDQFLAVNGDLEDHAHALMLRRRGYALGDLGRYDEALAAYQESLKYEPDSDAAKREMTWDRQQMAAGKSAPAAPAVYIEGTWTYPTTEAVQSVVKGFGPGQVELDCAVGRDGHLTECDMDATKPGRLVSDVFVKYTHVDPASVPGGIPAGARKKFTYKWQ